MLITSARKEEKYDPSSDNSRSPGYIVPDTLRTWDVAGCLADDVLHRALKSSNGLAYVWDDSAIIGFVYGHDVGFHGYLSELVVARDVRRKGIGRRLVQQVQKELTKRGCHLVMADTWHEAGPFYDSLGWVPVSDLVTLWKKDLKGTEPVT